MSLIGIIVAVLVLCVAIWAVRALMGAFGIGEPISTVVQVVIVLIVLIWIIGLLGFGPNLGVRVR